MLAVNVESEISSQRYVSAKRILATKKDYIKFEMKLKFIDCYFVKFSQ